MGMRTIPTWDQYYLDICKVVASRSKDPNTQIGCVVVGPNHEIRTTGYNSFPRGIRDGRIFPDQGGGYRPINKQHQLRRQTAGIARPGWIDVTLSGDVSTTIRLPTYPAGHMVTATNANELREDTAAWLGL